MLIHIKNVYKQKEIVVAVKNEQAYFKTRGLLKHQETAATNLEVKTGHYRQLLHSQLFG